MNRHTTVVYTDDAELLQRLSTCLAPLAKTKHVTKLKEMERLCRELGPTVLILDARETELQKEWAHILNLSSQYAVIVLGPILSDTLLEAESNGIYAVEEIDCDHRRMLALVNRAFDFLEMRLSHEKLQQENKQLSTTPTAPPPENTTSNSLFPWRQFSWAFRHSENVDLMLERIIESLASAASVQRAGIFARNREGDYYRLRAGVRCLEITNTLEYHKDDPLIHWFEIQAHLIAFPNLKHVKNSMDRIMLQQALDTLGAEVIVPLYAHGSMLGWIFVGHRATGVPFDYKDLDDLAATVDHISIFLENALLYEEVTLQKTLAETLLHSLPTGIVAVDNDGMVRWFNTAAQNILNVPSNTVLNQPIAALGQRIAETLRKSLDEAVPQVPKMWTDPTTKRVMHIQVRRLGARDKCLGAVAMIQDKTTELILKAKQEQLDRSAFWNELAASMSHEIHNPLVAIKTFAQLLPERYNDTEFRRDFSMLVSQEVDRLNSIIDQINQFAHPPEIKLQPIDIRQSIKKGLDDAIPTFKRERVKITAAIDNGIPEILGDEHALAGCFAHVIRNSIEALVNKQDAEITLMANRLTANGDDEHVAVTIKDNGRGIPPELINKVFSPFCTTKARGMGLGLPIVQRTILDHNGRVHVDSNDKGTAVTIMLPTFQTRKKYEESTHSG